MAATGSFRITAPDEVKMTVTITMSVREWKAIKKRLQPSAADAEWYLDDTIGKLIDKAGESFRFYEDVEK